MHLIHQRSKHLNKRFRFTDRSYLTAKSSTELLDLVSASLSKSIDIVLSEQYNYAMEIGFKIKQASLKNPNNTYTFTGHSLGGGLATLASLNSGIKSVVFNPAWVSQYWPSGNEHFKPDKYYQQGWI